MSATTQHSTSAKMDIRNPRRILALGAPNCGTLNVLKDLTGTAPFQPSMTSSSPDSTTIAGLSHAWAVKTSYYETTIPIWIDEISELSSWKADFLTDEAKDVISAVGGWMFCFRKPLSMADFESIKRSMEAIQEVVKTRWGYNWDGVCLAVATTQNITPHLIQTDDWEDICREFGFEYVDSEANGLNEFGELVGIPRVKEALEANDWSNDGAESVSNLDDFDPGEDDGVQDYEMREEDTIIELKNSLAARASEISKALLDVENSYVEGIGVGTENGGEKDVDDVELMFSRAMAIREMGASKPDAERKRFAAKAVNGLAKDFFH